MTPSSDDQQRGDDPQRHVAAYAALATGYSALVGAIALTARKTGRRAPRLSVGDLALLGVATFKVSRIVTRDRVTEFIRAPFTQFDRPGKDTEVLDKPVGTGVKRAVGELVSCPFCTSQWVATALTAGWIFAPNATRLAASGLTAVALSDLLQYGHSVLQEKAE